MHGVSHYDAFLQCPATNMRNHAEQNQQDHLQLLASVVETMMRDPQTPLRPELKAVGDQLQNLTLAEPRMAEASGKTIDFNGDLKKPVLQKTRSLASSGEKQAFHSGELGGENPLEILNELRNHVATQQQHIIELRSKVTHLENSLQDTRSELRDTKMDLRNRSCQGRFIWRLKNYQKLRQEAKRGAPNCVIHSPGFYTSFNGYQFCLRLNLNGVENARGTHLSLFKIGRAHV